MNPLMNRMMNPMTQAGLGILGNPLNPWQGAQQGLMTSYTLGQQQNQDQFRNSLMEMQMKKYEMDMERQKREIEQQKQEEEKQRRLSGYLSGNSTVPYAPMEQPQTAMDLAGGLANIGYPEEALGLYAKSFETKDPKITSAMANAEAMGFQPGTQAYNDYINSVTMPASTSVNVNTGEDPMSGIPSVNEAMKFVDAQGNRPPYPITYKELREGGYKMSSTQEQTKELDSLGAYATLNRLQELVNKTHKNRPVEPGGWNRIVADMDNMWDRFTQEGNKEMLLLESFKMGTIAPLIRAVGEKGNLATEDVERALRLIPSTGEGMGLPDTTEISQEKMKQLRGWFDMAMGKVKQEPNMPNSPRSNAVSDEELINKYLK